MDKRGSWASGTPIALFHLAEADACTAEPVASMETDTAAPAAPQCVLRAMPLAVAEETLALHR